MIVNLRTLALDEHPLAREGHAFRRTMLGQVAAADLTGFSIYELPPGQRLWAYHYELNREEWLFVIEGEVVVRTANGDVTMRIGDVTIFPIGPEGAHQVRNDSDAAARVGIPSSWEGPGYAAVRPDSNTVLINGPGFRQIVPLDESFEYWEREPWS